VVSSSISLPEYTMVDMVWILVCSGLVFTMQLGFLCLESGLTRSKNAINVAVKNMADFSIALLFFWAFGFALMFGSSSAGWIGTSQFFLSFEDNPWQLASFFLFQAMFCATAATIVSGAVAERMRFSAYIITTTLISAIIYPIFGHWAWGGFLGGASGWLAELGFVDFAGSTVVHSIGGWAALAAVLVIGPRAGRFVQGSNTGKVSGSNLPLAMLGTLLLWLGWIGFNGGSNLEINASVAGIICRTFLSGAAGMITAMFAGWVRNKHVDARLVINGSLAGLVAITASCHAATTPGAVLIGMLGACVIMGAEWLLERYHVDDAIGAVAVHGAVGAWGTLAVAIFSKPELLATGLSRWEQLQVQLLGMGVAMGYSFGITYVCLRLINHWHPLRVSLPHEQIGLNVSEHGASTELHDLLSEMEIQRQGNQFFKKVTVEPSSDVGAIALQYNRVMEQVQSQSEKAEQMLQLAKDSQAAAEHSEQLQRSQAEQLRQEVIERTQAVAKQKELQHELVQAQKLESIGQLAAGVAHEINTPMQFVSDNIHYLKDCVAGLFEVVTAYKENLYSTDSKKSWEARQAEITEITERCRFEKMEQQVPLAIEESLDGVQRVVTIVRAMKEFSHPGTHEKVFTDLNQAIHSAVTISRNRWKNIAQIQMDFDDQLPQVKTMPAEINQVLLNLVVNAADAILEKLDASGAEMGVITIRTFADEQHAMIQITDTGAGIPEEIVNRVFDPFFTTKEVGKGTGQGLAISRNVIVNKHQGELNVQSQPGEGTTFTIKLPLLASEATPEAETEVEDPAAEGNVAEGNVAKEPVAKEPVAEPVASH
jgi:ammonium transporter